jgi:putative phosphoesterase
MRTEDVQVVGLISDTHGLVRPDVFDALAGVQLILHAGDVGEQVLEELSVIAPVEAVYGNTDPTDDPRLQQFIEREIGGLHVHVSHGHEVGTPTPQKLLTRYAADVIVYGHTHRQELVEAEGRWVINPGAAGARRFNLLPSLARLTIARRRVSVEFVELKAGKE